MLSREQILADKAAALGGLELAKLRIKTLEQEIASAQWGLPKATDRPSFSHDSPCDTLFAATGLMCLQAAAPNEARAAALASAFREIIKRDMSVSFRRDHQTHQIAIQTYMDVRVLEATTQSAEVIRLLAIETGHAIADYIMKMDPKKLFHGVWHDAGPQ